MKDSIHKARKDRRMTAKEFGEILDVSENYIYKLESGLRTPSRELLFKMLDKFPELSILDFTGGKEIEKKEILEQPTQKANQRETKLEY